MANDIQEALRDSYILVTDYSSVFMDFAYMHKPVIYFQFDYNEYRKKQLQQGYFDYKRNGFGPIVTNQNAVIDAIKNCKAKSVTYNKRIDAFFGNQDSNNCKRIYDILAEEAK